MSNALHSMKNPAYGTPPELITASILTMGEITLDAASSPEANKLILAKKYYTREDNGLCHDWTGKVFLNPPGGVWRGDNKRPDNFAQMSPDDQAAWVAAKDADRELTRNQWLEAKKQPWWRGSQSIAITFLDKLLYDYRRGLVQQAIFVGFNVEIYSQRPEIFEFPICLTTAGSSADCINNIGRTKFLGENGEPATSPSHANIFVFLPPRRGRNGEAFDTFAVQTFIGHFSKFGFAGMMLNPLKPIVQTADGKLYIGNPTPTHNQSEVAA